MEKGVWHCCLGQVENQMRDFFVFQILIAFPSDMLFLERVLVMFLSKGQIFLSKGQINFIKGQRIYSLGCSLGLYAFLLNNCLKTRH